MVANTAGYQPIFDGAVSAFTGRCEAAVSGGWIVCLGSKSAPVTSGANSYATTDVLIADAASGTGYPIGVACYNAGSNSDVTVLQKGWVICTVAGAVTAGALVQGRSNNAVSAITAGSITEITLNQVIGRAMTSAGSEEYAIVALNI